MSISYRACFELRETAIDTIDFTMLHASLGIDYLGCDTRLVVVDGELFEEQTKYHDWNSYLRDIGGMHPSLSASFSKDPFDFELGFVIGPPSPVAVLYISDRTLWRMAVDDAEDSIKILDYLVLLFQVLRASSMAMGLECTFDKLVKFLAGRLDEDAVADHIRLAIGVNTRSAEMLRDCGGLDLVIRGTPVIAGQFPGRDEWLAQGGNYPIP